jgi:tagatose-6-phosphate ketose/aldose isomerase
MRSRAAHLKSIVADLSSLTFSSLTLTGSGSSEYAGDCVRAASQNELEVVTQAIGGGVLLAHRGRALPPARPGLMVSLARSGDSPESVGAVDLMLRSQPEIRHLCLDLQPGGESGEELPG